MIPVYECFYPESDCNINRWLLMRSIHDVAIKKENARRNAIREKEWEEERVKLNDVLLAYKGLQTRGLAE